MSDTALTLTLSEKERHTLICALLLMIKETQSFDMTIENVPNDQYEMIICVALNLLASEFEDLEQSMETDDLH